MPWNAVYSIKSDIYKLGGYEDNNARKSLSTVIPVIFINYSL